MPTVFQDMKVIVPRQTRVTLSPAMLALNFLNRIARNGYGQAHAHKGPDFRPFPQRTRNQVYPHCGYAVNDFTRTSLDDVFTIFPCFLGFSGRLWTFFEGPY